MDENLNREIPAVRLRAFRAVDDPEACEKFIEGHMHVLANFKIEKITSANRGWTLNPAVFVFIVESLDRSKVYGGVRLHVSGGTEPLPIEVATGHLDPNVYKIVKEYARFGTGEGCGLWNSREIAGYGIGSVFLSRAGIAGAAQVGVKSLFSLCAPYTVKLAENMGYRIEEDMGNKGTFYYPKLDLVATAMIHKDLKNISTADEESQKAILTLIHTHSIVRIETLRKKQIEIHYEMAIPNLKDWSMEDTIANAMSKEY